MRKLGRAPNTAFRDLDGETVVITLHDRRIHVLNETAAVVYRLAVEGRPADDAVTALCSAYDVEPDAARQDVADVREDLVSRRLLAEDPA
jgi:hypothetical protein